MQTIHYATTNAGKVIALQDALTRAGLENISLNQCSIDLLEIQSDSLAEICLFKAKQAFEKLQRPVIVQDSAFGFAELNGYPGPYAKNCLEKFGIERIATLAATFNDKSFQFENALVYFHGPDDYKVFTDNSGDLFTVSDKISPIDHPKQWSPIWKLISATKLGHTKAFSELNDAEMEDFRFHRDQICPSVTTQFADYLKHQEALSHG